jgi:cysteinyl-tRNA synthetase|nr:cysteine--tRNA ligase [Bradyrhizobium sp.]
MELRLYDTLTREKRAFVPLDPANVRLYVCGPTVYDFAHIGNARPVIVFDVLFRLLRHLYGEARVTYVRNITDVDDKINDRAARDFPGLPLNDAIRKVTEKTASQFHADVKALGCLPPTFEPRATDFVLPRADGKTDMVTLIRQLIARGHAYEAGGEVLFDTQSMPDYGALSGRRLDEQQAGARVAVDAHKKHPTDFVLWKLSSDNEPGWESPWGRGRPGWHIECSAMSAAYLGDVFDIHGGGLDLIFPHHENEIAQSRCAHGTAVMANYWMHNGFLQIEGAKMSKSDGNFVTISEALKDWPGEVLRLNMLKTHYRSPIDWTVASLKESQTVLDRWRRTAFDHDVSRDYIDVEVKSALTDDLNTPKALTRLHELYSMIKGPSSGLPRLELQKKLKASANLLGLIETPFEVWHRGLVARQTRFELSWDETLRPHIATKISERNAARARKDFKESDRIRDELAAMGVVLKDSKDSAGQPVTTWEIAR